MNFVLLFTQCMLVKLSFPREETNSVYNGLINAELITDFNWIHKWKFMIWRIKNKYVKIPFIRIFKFLGLEFSKVFVTK